jgi:hypothetical protein
VAAHVLDQLREPLVEPLSRSIASLLQTPVPAVVPKDLP